MKQFPQLILLFMIGILSPIYGNNIPYPFSQYNYTYLTEDKGLPHSFVDDIFKDSQGYMWLSTHNGLARYDGYTFVTFSSVSLPVSLKSNYVYKACEDNFNRLWVATKGGIDIIDLKQYRNIEIFSGKDEQLFDLMNVSSSSIYKDKRGNMWISVENTLCCIELDNNGDVSNYYYLEKGESNSQINAVIDLGWAICAGINSSVKRLDKRNNHTLVSEPVSKLVNAYYGDLKIHCMEADDDILWIGTNRGLFKYEHFEQNLKRYRYSSSKSGMLSQSHITDIKKDSHGTLFVATLNGLNIYDRENDTFSFVQKNKDQNLSTLNCNFINCLFIDSSSIWLGTEIGGVNLMTLGRLVTQIWQYNPIDKGSLSPNPVNAICEDKNGNLWVGTVEGGLNLMRKGRNSFEHFLSDENDINTISHNSVCGILIDSDNHLWAYTWGIGVNELDLNIPNNKCFRRYSKGKMSGMEANFVSSACEDIINRGIWFGTTEGLHFFDKEMQEFRKIELSQSSNQFETMGVLFVDKKNRLWAGTSNGIFIIDLFSFARSRIHFDYVHIKNILPDPISSNPDKINCVIQDREGVIWLGSDGNGLYKLISDKNGIFQFENYTTEDGLPNNCVIGIVEDNNNCLWLSTNQGISQLDKREMTFCNYTKYDGLPTNQFYWNAYIYSKTKDLIYFGNLEGLIAIHPKTREEKEGAVKVYLTGLNILGNPVYPSSGGFLENDISSAKRIQLHESDKTFAIDFSAKNYKNIDQIRYAYRLKGYDADWNKSKIGEHSAKYTSVPPGKYIFQVRTTDSRGYWSNEIKEIEVYITPHFYKSWWFYFLLFVFIVFCIQRFFAWKMKSYHLQQKALEKIVEERTQELEIQNKQLIEVGRKLANTTEEKIAFFTNIIHEFRTPVTLINGPLEQAMKHTENPIVSQNLQIAERSSKYLLTLVNELMDYRKLDVSKIQLEPVSNNFKSFMEFILMPFQAYTADIQIKLNVYYHIDNPYIILDYQYIRKVILNLVSNAIKYTPNNGNINIYVATLNKLNGQKQLYINVRDNGSGILEDDLDKIFDCFYQSINNNRGLNQNNSGTGIGLYFCKEIIQMHGGKIEAHNNKNRGASFRIFLPYIEGGAPVKEIEKVEDLLAENKKIPDNRNNETILIVDDNADMRIYISSLLSPNYNILEAKDGAEALAIIQTKPIDLIISDLMMPVMDGIELSRKVKENISISHIPFLILTAVVSEEQKKASFEIGVDEYLSKPFDEDMLLLRIHNILNLRKNYKAKFLVSMNSNDLNLEVESKDQRFMKIALELMKVNYGDSEYEIDEFVKDVGYSKTLVNKKLQDLVGLSIGQFMRNYRLNIAHQILINASDEIDLNISEIAYSVGFNDPKYFTRCFKEFFGVLPSTLLSKK